jgi:hypothetical protein
MKNIIIAGVPRSGKTILAKCMNEEHGFSIYSADAIVSTFGKIIPEHGISHFENDHGKACEAFHDFLRELLHQLEYEDIPFIFESYHVMPHSLVDLTDAYSIVFMGYPSVVPAEKCDDIRRHARPKDWTQDLSDDQLCELIQRFIDESKILDTACSKLDIPFIDTGAEFEHAVRSAAEMLSQSVRERI